MEHQSTDKAGVFISHITHEKPVALVLQKYIRQAYGPDFPVFVSTDDRSIPGGEGWWQFIRDEIRKYFVVLSLVSDESAKREWVNYEAGIGDGSGAKVIPIAIRTYRFDKLDFPLKGFQGRYPADLEGILLDISKEIGTVAGSVDMASYLAELRQAEDSLIYKNLIFRPIRTRMNRQEQLQFEMENRGNVDIALLFAEVWVPRCIIAQNSPISSLSRPPVMEMDAETPDYLHVQHYTAPGIVGVRRLEPVITKSMGIRRIRDLRFALSGSYGANELKSVVRYQIHAANYDTVIEESHFQDIQEVSQ